jgi:hypothetical protein
MLDYKYAHVPDWDHRSIRIDLATPLEQLLGCFDRVEHDDDLAKHMEGQNIA